MIRHIIQRLAFFRVVTLLLDGVLDFLAEITVTQTLVS